MDPLFGLPAIRDTPAMNIAKQRNYLQEKVLQERLGDLDNTCTSITSRINSERKQLHQVLKDLHPNKDQHIGIVVPRGLSTKEQDGYRKLRRGSLPSMSLDEFDQKLNCVLQDRKTEREEVFKVNSQYFNGRKIRMAPLPRRHSPHDSLENIGIVPLDLEISSNKYSGIMRRALKRASSEGSQIVASKNDNLAVPLPTRRPVSDHCTLVRRPSVSGEFEEADDISPLPSTRNSSGATSPTLPDIRNGKIRGWNNIRRATMPELKSLYLLNRKPSLSAQLSPDAMLSKLDDIMKTWRSAPAVKRTLSDGNIEQSGEDTLNCDF